MKHSKDRRTFGRKFKDRLPLPGRGDEISNNEIFSGHTWWYANYNYKDLDAALKPFLHDDIHSANCDSAWLTQVRKAMQLTLENVAERLGVSRAALAKLEKNERLGKISIEKLEAVANALDCELVYAIRPKRKILFSDVIWAKLLRSGRIHPQVKLAPTLYKGRALAAVMQRKLKEPNFRVMKNWSRQR